MSVHYLHKTDFICLIFHLVDVTGLHSIFTICNASCVFIWFSSRCFYIHLFVCWKWKWCALISFSFSFFSAAFVQLEFYFTSFFSPSFLSVCSYGCVFYFIFKLLVELQTHKKRKYMLMTLRFVLWCATLYKHNSERAVYIYIEGNL